MQKIIFFGDVVGKAGRLALKKYIPQIKKQYDPDLIIANGENIAHGMGITKKTLNEGLSYGVDFFTSGNHIFDRKEALEILREKDAKIIRPANYPPKNPGQGFKVLKVRTSDVMIVNLMGRVFIKEDFDCPFRILDAILKEKENNVKTILVDFHAEATSETIAFTHYFDGRVSAVLGTHTHVPTQDFEITKKGTAKVCDIGMVGAKDSVLGFEKEAIIERFLTQTNLPFEVAEGDEVQVNAAYLEIDQSGKIKKFEKIYETISI